MLFFVNLLGMKRIVILSGAGMSAESGVKTFRDQDGLWRNHRIEEVASPIAWHNNRELVLEFYNIRRKQLYEVEPNPGHIALTKLEEHYHVDIITQNVDDLHERAGSKNILHLHGELKKVRSSVDENLVYTLDGWELKEGDLCEKGSQLRPHIVWFGEAVPNIEPAVHLVQQADIVIVIGTSMVVYPAAGLINYAPAHAQKYLVDPNTQIGQSDVEVYQEKAGTGVPKLVEKLIKESTD